MRTKAENKAAILDFIKDWTLSTERIIGAKLRRQGVKLTDRTQKNIRFKIAETLNDNLELTIHFRDSLKFTDMGAGNGYHKGIKIGRQSILFKGRKPKKIINKPLYGRLAVLQTGLINSVISEIILTIK